MPFCSFIWCCPSFFPLIPSISPNCFSPPICELASVSKNTKWTSLQPISRNAQMQKKGERGVLHVPIRMNQMDGPSNLLFHPSSYPLCFRLRNRPWHGLSNKKGPQMNTLNLVSRVATGSDGSSLKLAKTSFTPFLLLPF